MKMHSRIKNVEHYQTGVLKVFNYFSNFSIKNLQFLRIPNVQVLKQANQTMKPSMNSILIFFVLFKAM